MRKTFHPISVLGGRSFSLISSDGSTVVALEASTGRAYAWGAGGSRQMGNNTILTTSSPVSVFGAKSYSNVYVGTAYTLALEGSTGNAYCWGIGSSGQNGNGTSAARSSPVSVLGGR